MSRIDDLIAEHCSAGVPFKTLGEVGTFVRGSGLQKKDFVDDGFPCIHYGQIYTFYGTAATVTKSFITPELAARLKQAKRGDLVVTTTSESIEDVCTAVAWLGGGPIAIGGHSCVFKHTLDPMYAAYYFQTEQFELQKRKFVTGTKVKDIKIADIARVKIPVPSLAIQREIAAILDKMESLKSELESELELRSRQYAYYRDFLLTLAEGERVGWAALSDLFDMRAGKFIKASEIATTKDAAHPVPVFGGGGLRGYASDASHVGERVLIGRQGALCGNVKRTSGQFYATEHAVVVEARPEVDIRWAFHMLTAMNLNQYASKSAQPGLAVGTIAALKVPVPRYGEQQRIGTILDKFDALLKDLSFGLPAEIKARQAQFKHYRDRLLSFEELAA